MEIAEQSASGMRGRSSGVGVEECRNIASRDVVDEISSSSEIPGCEVSNLLVRDPQQLWLSDLGIPQYLDIHFAVNGAISAQSECCIRTLGWYCWHSYTTNPSRVVVKVSRNGTSFESHCTIEGSSRAGIHLRSVNPAIDVRKYPHVRLVLDRVFGGDRVYMNRLYLYRESLEKVENHVQRLLSSGVASVPVKVESSTDIKSAKGVRKSRSREDETFASSEPSGAVAAPSTPPRRAVKESGDGDGVRHSVDDLIRKIRSSRVYVERKLSDRVVRSISDDSEETFPKDGGNFNEHDLLQKNLKDMETLVDRCVKHRRTVSASEAVEGKEKISAVGAPTSADDHRGVVPSNKRTDDDLQTNANSGAVLSRVETCIRSIDKMERRVSKLTKTMGAIVTQLDLDNAVAEAGGSDADRGDRSADDIFDDVPKATYSTPSPRRDDGTATPSPSPLQKQLQPMLERILTTWATRLLSAQSESMHKRLDRRLKLERKQMLTQLVKAQRSFAETWSAQQMKKFESIVRRTRKAVKKQSKRVRFTLDCSVPVGDNVINIDTFAKFLTDRIKVNGKAGVLGDAVKVEAKDTQINVDAKLPFSKRYLKYLSKKYLKKQQLRDYLHVIATSANAYQLKYFNITQDEEDEEEEE
eukprot:g2051.t1